MKRAKSTTKNVWETTGEACLLRNKHSLQYYGRFSLWGKQKWVNLNTDVFSVAEIRVLEESKKIKMLRAQGPNIEAGRATMGELMEMYLERSRNNSDLQPSSVVSRETALKKVQKTWKSIELLTPKQITPAAVQEFG